MQRNGVENRINHILLLLLEAGEISKDEYKDARFNQKVSFDFAPGIYSIDNRLVNNIKREIDRELGPGSSDSGIVLITSIDMNMQRILQSIIDRNSRRIYVDHEDRVDGQPSMVRLEGGGRIIKANEKLMIKG